MSPSTLTNIERVLQALRRRATPPNYTVKVTGEELSAEIGLPKTKIHDSIFQLVEKKWVKKVGRGARYKPMVLQLLEPGRARLSKTAAGDMIVRYLGDPDIWYCPHCGEPINLRELRAEKKAQLEKALAELGKTD